MSRLVVDKVLISNVNKFFRLANTPVAILIYAASRVGAIRDKDKSTLRCVDRQCVYIISFYTDRLYLRDFHSRETSSRATDTPRKSRDQCTHFEVPK